MFLNSSTIIIKMTWYALLISAGKQQQRHYDKYIQICQTQKNPKHHVIKPLLDAEYMRRRRTINELEETSNSKISTILGLYPSFKDIDHVSSRV